MLTDLSTIQMPADGRAWVQAADPEEMIFQHKVEVDLDWWNTALTTRDLPGGLLRGARPGDPTTTSGIAKITRGQVFDLAREEVDDPGSALRLLWHAMAWGTGSRRRLVLQRMNAVASDLPAASQALIEAAQLARSAPTAAYERLAPRGRNVISYLGPAFFTKYLYFAGAGRADHPCLILDARVAQTLIDTGWTSMHSKGGWPSATYGRYLNDVITPWHEASPSTPTAIGRDATSLSVGCSTQLRPRSRDSGQRRYFPAIGESIQSSRCRQILQRRAEVQDAGD